eukprot:8199114-Alexandrium_andersonii.AAC.1
MRAHIHTHARTHAHTRRQSHTDAHTQGRTLRHGRTYTWANPEVSVLLAQRLTYTDRRVQGAASRLQQFAAVCSGLLRGLGGGATAAPDAPQKRLQR